MVKDSIKESSSSKKTTKGAASSSYKAQYPPQLQKPHNPYTKFNQDATLHHPGPGNNSGHTKFGKSKFNQPVSDTNLGPAKSTKSGKTTTAHTYQYKGSRNSAKGSSSDRSYKHGTNKGNKGPSHPYSDAGPPSDAPSFANRPSVISSGQSSHQFTPNAENTRSQHLDRPEFPISDHNHSQRQERSERSRDNRARKRSSLSRRDRSTDRDRKRNATGKAKKIENKKDKKDKIRNRKRDKSSNKKANNSSSSRRNKSASRNKSVSSDSRSDDPRSAASRSSDSHRSSRSGSRSRSSSDRKNFKSKGPDRRRYSKNSNFSESGSSASR